MSEIIISDNRYMTVDFPTVIADAIPNTSKSQARRLLRDGAVKIDGEPYKHLTCAFMDVDGKVIKVGKRNFFRVVAR